MFLVLTHVTRWCIYRSALKGATRTVFYVTSSNNVRPAQFGCNSQGR
jgi:hypothetical protein